ncbi:MFS transporter [Streptomyces anthocyanicus]|uniref:Major facilitator transporter n=1 Tax=Streptomyces lividans 1326 TaxID=1200984 RepID=A0A7U9H8Y5_STRLI|nr:MULTISPECIES: MFS transporter [Streptomyces]EOY45823.1 major facilitator transporter [Streptomyces lividans 1326]KKD10636.1 major facilitator transporter [Streptomyces sp. WM6391]
MSYRSPASPATTALDRPARPGAALPALCLTQITSWGIVYYAFPVLNPQITMATGWSATATTAAFSAALLMSAVAGISIGRILDARGPRTVMTVGSVVGTVSLVFIASAPNLTLFTAGWLLAGFAMASTFYQPAFAALTRWWAPNHVRALTIVTLAGGLASTAFAPLTAQLANHFSWRHTYLLLALVLATVTVPLHAYALRGPWPPAPSPSTTGETASTVVITHSRPFLLLATALTLSAFAAYAVVITLVPLLLDRGYTAAEAAWALGLGGAGQTLGRTLYASLARRSSPALRAAVLIGMGGLTTAAFALIPGPYGVLAALAVIAGTVRGNLTLLQATAITDRWGANRYGRLSGILAAPTTTASALAPFAGTALAAPLGGYPHLFAVLALTSSAAALIAWYTAPTTAATRP